jgi:flagellar hook-associated protein 3 FlgL
MRITNTMITNNTKNNINSNKIYVDKYNTQMTTQKKISKASDDPVIAIRSLRLATDLSQLDQYADNNIPDAEKWLDVTYTALNNMVGIVTDVRTQCVDGSNDPLTEDDRQTILQSLTSLTDQIYTEGNADYSGRTIFTGYRTSSNLTFDTDEEETVYQIDQSFSYSDMEEHRYYKGTVEVPAVVDASTAECQTDVGTNSYDRIRLAYDEIGSVDGFSYSYGSGAAKVTVSTETAADGRTPTERPWTMTESCLSNRPANSFSEKPHHRISKAAARNFPSPTPRPVLMPESFVRNIILTARTRRMRSIR